jgi:hypothetical protein
MMTYVVDSLDQYEEIKNRERVFSSAKQQQIEAENKKQPELKEAAADILDIGLHTGYKGLETLKKQPIYKLTDQYVKYDQKVELLKNQSIDFANFVNDRVYFPMREKIVFIYDEASQYISFMVQIFAEHQSQVQSYVQTHYENVKVELLNNWMKLDFDKDGIVSIEDFKKGLLSLYEFLLNFNYIQQAQTIKSSVYEKAITYMKKEVT